MKALLVGPAHSFKDEDVVSSSQFHPFFENRSALRRELDLEFQHINAHTFAEIEVACESKHADIFFIRPIWQQEAEDAERVMENLRKQNPTAKIFFLDPFDQTSSRFFNVLPYVDKLLKYQGLKDNSIYGKCLTGGTFLTHKLAHEHSYDIKDWSVQSTIPKGLESRIDSSWFITLTPRFKLRLLASRLLWNQWWPKRTKDIFCHVSYGPRDMNDWYCQHRKDTIEALQQLPSNIKLSVSGDYTGESKISSQQYRYWIKRSRISFSPFGWGEVTWRDYESVIYGCLLMKPHVDHIAVEPNIFIPEETYVPVQWDYSDLAEKCQYYLEHPEKANRIINNAREVYINYFKEAKFLKKVESLIKSSSQLRDCNTQKQSCLTQS